MVDLILKKRGGEALSPAEIHWFVHGFTEGEIPDYQVSALMMAIFFKGMDEAETVELVQAMIKSGDVIDLGSIPGKKVDKHSTGGVGDKTSIVLAPMVAACGAPVAKLSGRGLGHTGGTLDKLEAFKGLHVELGMEDFVAQVNRIGIAIASQTGNLVPADKKLYALRDVTGTVENMSLIAGSIMSKKLASGAEAIVLDVKTGSGAFMKTEAEAFALAEEMVRIGEAMGRRTVSLVSDMEQPLGRAIGNAMEVQEAISTLSGHGPEDLVALCMALGSEMLVLSEHARDLDYAREMLAASIESGSALQKLREFVEAQGGDGNQVYHPESMPGAAYEQPLFAEQSGYVTALTAQTVGHASMVLGAGRETKSSPIDMGAGIYLYKKVGDPVQAGEVLATLHTNTAEKIEEARLLLAKAYVIGKEAVEARPLIFGRVGG